MARRACKGKTKAGKRCRAAPLTDSTFCLAHTDELTRAKAGFGGSANGAKGGRPRNPRAVDVLRQRIEADIDKVLDPLWEALQADRGIALTVKGGGMEIGSTPDHPTRIVAARELLDRAYGRAKSTGEVTVITKDAFAQAMSELQAEVEELEDAGDRGEQGGDRAGTTPASTS